jgi:hypothetical protein
MVRGPGFEPETSGTGLQIAKHSISIIVLGELEGTEEKAVVIYFKVLSRHASGKTEKLRKRTRSQ